MVSTLKIITLGDEALRQKAAPVKEIRPLYREIAEQMINLMVEGGGVGLAGPQVGFMERIFVAKHAGEPPRIFINPSIIATSEDRVKHEEGCLSLPGVWADVIRPKTLTVQAWNERGRPFTLEASGILGRIIQHECDHLNGILFIDHLSELKRKRIIMHYEKLRKRRR
ncbi:MAG: peptide deformylase [Spirochaetaceae bacterium]|jgi:peptide deformylase|nr:peptide deformylase [Spirochaetaceae bacterium]